MTNNITDSPHEGWPVECVDVEQHRLHSPRERNRPDKSAYDLVGESMPCSIGGRIHDFASHGYALDLLPPLPRWRAIFRPDPEEPRSASCNRYFLRSRPTGEHFVFGFRTSLRRRICIAQNAESCWKDLMRTALNVELRQGARRQCRSAVPRGGSRARSTMQRLRAFVVGLHSI
jgi:hypothetical protein